MLAVCTLPAVVEASFMMAVRVLGKDKLNRSPKQIAQVPVKYQRQKEKAATYFHVLWRRLSSACAGGTHCKRLDPPIFNQDCRPCTHQNSESEPPSIERHRHLIFFSCLLFAPEELPKLTRIPSHLLFSFLFYFVSSIPVLPFLSSSSHYHSQRIGPRRVRRNWSRCFYLDFSVAISTLLVFERRISLLHSSHQLLTRLRDYHFRYFTHTHNPTHYARQGLERALEQSVFCIKYPRECLRKT